MAIPFTAQQGQAFGSYIGIGVAAVIILLRSSRARVLKIERLWIRPAIFMALLVVAVYAAPPPLEVPSLTILAAALVLGCGLGWQRARFMRIEVHPETHEMKSQPSVWGLVFIFALLAVRFGLRSVLSENARVLGVSGLVITDAFIVFAVGMMVTQGVEIWIRARRLLTEAQSAKAARDQSIVTE